MRINLTSVLVDDQAKAFRQAARADAGFAEEYRKVLDNRARAFSEFIDGLQDRLGPGIDGRTATDLLWALSNEELYRELVQERGWSHDRFEQWLARTLVAQLLDHPAVPPPTRTPRKRRTAP